MMHIFFSQTAYFLSLIGIIVLHKRKAQVRHTLYY